MDLIPADFRRLRRVRSYLRATLFALGLLLIIFLLGWLGLQTLVSREQQQISRLQQDDGRFQRDQSSLAELRQKRQQIEEQLNTLAGLRGGDQVAKLLRAIDAAHTTGIWLDNMQMHRATDSLVKPESPSANTLGGLLGKIQGVGNAPGSGVNIVGHALDHTHLAEFMKKLSDQPGMARLYLIETRPRGAADIDVIDFTLFMQLETLKSARQ
jgi:cell division protein FtsB